MTLKRRVLRAVWLATAIGLAAAPAGAQQFNGRIDGALVDQTGGVLPGVSVALSGEAAASQQAVSDANGQFRFLNLAPSTYTVTAKLAGFADVVRSNIIVEIGASTRVDLQMRPAVVAETVTVTAESPVVDAKQPGNVTHFDQDTLQKIPTARDPWVLLQQVPGVLVDRVNVGGNESGQQSLFIKGASDGSDTMWNIDGVTITDPAAIGSSPTYYDFDTFQEVQFTTGGNDPRQQTGGIGINFVTKRGTNVPHGSARVFYTNDDLQSDNIPANLRALPPSSTFPKGFIGNKVKRVRDMGFEVGGPMLKDKLWGWGSLAKNNINNTIITGFPDNTQLKDASVKVSWQANTSNQITGFWYRGLKTKQGRNAGVTRPPETTWNQGGPTNIYKIEDSLTLGNRSFVTARYAYIDSAFSLTPQGGLNANVWFEGNTGVWHGSFLSFETQRPVHQVQVDGNTFASHHELKYGFQYRRVSVTSLSTWPGNGVIADVDDELAFIERDGFSKERETIAGFYAGDTITSGRFTANLNVRYDRQYGNNKATAVKANPIFPDLLPALSFPGRSRDFTFNDWSPRLGLTFALDEARKTIVRGSYARYGNQLNTGQINVNNPLITNSELDYGWTDLNGDKVVQRNELDFSYLAGSYYVDPANPTSIVPPNRIDPGISNQHTQEVIVGVDRELMPAFAVGANFSYGRTNDVIWQPLVGITRADFVPNATPVTGTIDGQAYSATWFRLRRGVTPLPGNARIETNRPGYHTYYRGLQFTAKKRLQNHWMMKGSFTFNTPRRHFGDPNTSIQDPTSTQSDPTEQNSLIAIGSGGGSGSKGDVFINSRWQFNVNGMYQAPFGINLAANLLGRQGYPTVFYHRIVNPDGFSTFKRIKPFDIDRFRDPNLYVLDTRVEKEVHLGRANFTAGLDVFNIANKSYVLQRFSRVNTSTAGQTREILSPRIVRFGLRFNF